MGNKEEILEILKSENLTASEIAIKQGISVNSVKTYLQRLKNDKLVMSITKKGREMVWSINTKEVSEDYKESVELLKFLNKFFKDNYKHLSKSKSIIDFVMRNEDKFNRIEVLGKLD